MTLILLRSDDHIQRNEMGLFLILLRPSYVSQLSHEPKGLFYHVILIKAFKEYYYLSYIALPHTRAQQSNSCLTNKATNRVLFGIKKKSFLSFCYETFYLWVLWQESFIFISVVHNKKIKIRNKDLYPFNTEEHSATVGLLLKF